MPSFCSVSRYPGRTGTWFYSRFFAMHGLNHDYSAMAADDIGPVMQKFADDHACRGLSVSMPFKKDVLAYLDVASTECQSYQLCNTVIKEDGRLLGHNCDHEGALHVTCLVRDLGPVMLLGNGAIGTMLAAMLQGSYLTVVARGLGNWQARHGAAKVLINATGMGTISSESPVEALHHDVELVVDLAMKPGVLADQCSRRGIRYVDGLVFYRYQFAKQYKLYTGIDIGEESLDDAIGSYRKIFFG